MADEVMATLNVTYNGNGELPDRVDYATPDADLLRIAEESIRQGYIPGIPADPNASLQGFVVERFPATGVLPDRMMIRPKTDFGSC